MRRILVLLIIATMIVAAASFISQPQKAAADSFTLEQIKSYPFPNELTSSATGSRIAWAFNERGARNVWVAEGPEFKARRLTNYEVDDGQELTQSFAFSRWQVRGLCSWRRSRFKLRQFGWRQSRDDDDPNESSNLERSICRWRAEAFGRRRRTADLAEERQGGRS